MQVGSFKRRKPPCSNEPGVCSWFCTQQHTVLIGHVPGALSWALGRPRGERFGRPRGGMLVAHGGASRYGRASPKDRPHR